MCVCLCCILQGHQPVYLCNTSLSTSHDSFLGLLWFEANMIWHSQPVLPASLSANKYYFIFIVSSQILIPRWTDLSTCQMYKWSKIYLTLYLMQLLPVCIWTLIINKVAHFHCLPVLFALLLLLMLLSSLVTCFVMHELNCFTEIIQWLLFCFVPKV